MFSFSAKGMLSEYFLYTFNFSLEQVIVVKLLESKVWYCVIIGKILFEVACTVLITVNDMFYLDVRLVGYVCMFALWTYRELE